MRNTLRGASLIRRRRKFRKMTAFGAFSSARALSQAFARSLGQHVNLDKGADEVTDQVDNVAFAVEYATPQIGVLRDVRVFGKEAFANGADAGGRLFLLPGREGQRRWGDVGFAHGVSFPEAGQKFTAAGLTDCPAED